MKSIVLAGAVALGSFVVPSAAVAGNETFKNAAGDQVRIACKNSGCTVKARKAGEKKFGLVEKTKGGSKNYKLLVTKYEAAGFK